MRNLRGLQFLLRAAIQVENNTNWRNEKNSPTRITEILKMAKNNLMNKKDKHEAVPYGNIANP